MSAAVSPPDSPVSAPPSLSTVRLLARPRFTPNRLMPAPIPLAVATGFITALAAPLPMSTTAPPAEARNTSLLDTSCSAAIARISSIRVASCRTAQRGERAVVGRQMELVEIARDRDPIVNGIVRARPLRRGEYGRRADRWRRFVRLAGARPKGQDAGPGEENGERSTVLYSAHAS